MIEMNLQGPETPDEQTPANVIGNISLCKGEKLIPFMNDAQQNDAEEKPHLRFYSIGPSTCQISCPLCNNRADTETVQMSGILGSLSCLISALSCCFPIFSLSFVYLCLQSRYKSKRLFCNKCGGYLGYYWRPN